jgi:ATP-binding cassette, subfamily B, heavy metal transporter
VNDLNNESNNKAVDSLLNFETVKYFCNEEHESNRYYKTLVEYSKVSIKSQNSLSLLNAGQALIIVIGQFIELVLAAYYVTKGTMTVGDFVLVNTYLLQLYEPLEYLGSS